MDYAEAARHFQMAADMESTEAESDLAYMYLSGLGVEMDRERGMRFLHRCARLGNGAALHTLGEYFLNGSFAGDFKTDARRAISYYRRAEWLGNTLSRVKMGHLYKEGKGLHRNPGKAVARFQRATDVKDASGMVAFGICVRDGLGTEKNSQKAVELFRTAADMGSKEGKVLLGLCFRRGEGVERNDTSAMSAFRQAARSLPFAGLP